MKNNFRGKIRGCCTLLLSLASFSTLFSQSIWTNPITNTNPSAYVPFTIGDVNLSSVAVSGISRGSGAAANAGSNRYNAMSWNTNAIDLTAYFEWTLSPNSGYEIDFTSFVYTGQASGTGPANFAFRSSLDGYTTNIGTPTDNGATISLSASIYQNVNAPITFRIYGWGTSSSTGTWSINDFTFNGAVNSGTGTLPIELIDFTANEYESGFNKVEWKVSLEENIQFYTVEKSHNAIDFSEMGSFFPSQSHSSLKSYVAMDDTPFSDITYYRLLTHEKDGSIVSHKTISLESSINKSKPACYQKENELVIDFKNAFPKNGAINLYDLSGKVMISASVNDLQTLLNIQNISSGIYTVSITNPYQTENFKILISH